MKSKGGVNLYIDNKFVGKIENVEVQIEKPRVGYVGGIFPETAEITIKKSIKVIQKNR